MVRGGGKWIVARPVLTLAVVLSSGCLQDQGLGPDVGACAGIPDRAFTFGEAEIGTCIAGPADLQFVQIDGATHLLVSNADPYQNYTSGSLLVIDWDALDLDTAPSRTLMDTVTAASNPLDNDRYMGQIGLILDRTDGLPLALVPSRFSGESRTVDVDDAVHVVDLSDPSSPVRWSEGPEIVLGADPMHVAVAEGRAYVSHLSEDYLAVINTDTTPLSVAVLSGGARISEPTFDDADGSGSRATLSETAIVSPGLLLSETWTMTWADATWRFWVPGIGEDGGVERWDLGGGLVIPAPANPVIAGATFDDPVDSATLVFGEGGTTDLWLASGGSFFLAQSSGGDAWAVDVQNDLALPRGRTGNTPEALDAPSVFVTDEGSLVAFDARLDGGTASIGVGSQLTDGAWAVDDVAALVPPQGASYEDPSVALDPFWTTPRMWLSERDADGAWRILESVSSDGRTWSAAVPVEGLPENTASPIVNWFNGSYVGWFSIWDGSSWSLGRSRSIDGLVWDEIEIVESFPGATDPARPPRPAVLTSVLGGFRVEGSDSGRFDGLAVDGDLYDATLAARGFGFEVSTGFVAEGPDLDEDLGLGGIAPGSRLLTPDGALLYVSLEDGAGRSRLARMAVEGDQVDLASGELVLPLDESGLTDASDPVTFGEDGSYTLLFAETDENVGTRIRRATSTDGLAWALQPDPVLASVDVEFAGDALLPGSVQTLDDGRLRLWYTAVGGGTARIGSALSDDGGASFTFEPGDPTLWRLSAGSPGSFDDAGVRDPHVFAFGGETWLAYAGSDGSDWRLGLARLEDPASGALTRRLDLTGETAAWLPLLPRTFAAGGSDHPVVVSDADGLSVWFAGEGTAEDDPQRLGHAIGTPEALYADLRLPTRGDSLRFTTIDAGGDSGQIVLSQNLDGFSTTSAGLSGMRIDPDRGMLYMTSDTSNGIVVIDVDRARGQPDTNVDDIEAVLRVRTNQTAGGFRDVVGTDQSDLLYATARIPDAVAVLDGSLLVDNSEKEAIEDVLIGVLPMRTSTEDVGAVGTTQISGGVMALREIGGRRHLFVPHFRDNSVSVFDLDRGDFGELVGYIPNIGENPHVARLSPDGRHVAIANFLGEVEDGFVSSTITILDADPDSPTFLDVVTTLVNR